MSHQRFAPRLLSVWNDTNEEGRDQMDPRVVWAAKVLRAQRMPASEIDSVFEADEPEEIRRRFELHGERLQERLVEQLRTLARVESLLTETLGRRPAPERPALSPAGRR